jgi:2-hydroxychromene-2-carboxylate isomerase
MSRAAAFALCGALAFGLAGCQDLKPNKGKSGSSSKVADSDKVNVKFYVMSKCPFGTQVEQGIGPVLDEIGDYIDFHIDFIANEANGTFTALHGQPEVDGNIIQLCAMKATDYDSKAFMKFIACQNENMRQIPEGWQGCATKAGLDSAKIDSCFKGAEGKTLLRESLKRAQNDKAQGSPTMFVGGEPYDGGRSKNDFLRAICGKMKGDKPEPCRKIPEPVEVKVVVLTDQRCKECATQGLESNLRGRFFPKLTVRTVDYGTDEGKKLFKELGLKFLPAWLFEAGVEKAERYDTIERWMVATGKYKQLRVPSNFDPTAEICDNQKDDTADGKVDCADTTCKGKLVCREEKKNDVQVFVMSQCPFGVKAIDAMKKVLTNFDNKVAFDIHYIADKTPTGFSALHGQPEVDENIRQLCAKKIAKKGDKYLDYIWCRNKDYRSNEWKGCAKEAKLDAAKLEKCATGPDGAKLLEEDIKIAKELDISGSPTWLANNRFKFSGIQADQIKQNICQRNNGLANCDKQLDSPQEAQAAPAGSCN